MRSFGLWVSPRKGKHRFFSVSSVPLWSISICWASLFRKLSRYPRSSNSSGSPSGAVPIRRISTPGVTPISNSRRLTSFAPTTRRIRPDSPTGSSAATSVMPIASKAPSAAASHRRESKACCPRRGGCKGCRSGPSARVRRRAGPILGVDECELVGQRLRRSRPFGQGEARREK